ncbi:MAG: divalent-cation tolerance protein CutA [Candidatus Melainabacteria bacterium]|nr:divalent-cation tolerance protein CutA [Candidatus Melainabacteria bacterium]
MTELLAPAYRLVFVTCPCEEEAQTLAKKLVEQKRVACANLIPGIQSIYWWEGAVQEASEWLLILKTTVEQLPALLQWLPNEHSYSVPEVIALPITEGHPPYLRWITESTTTLAKSTETLG